MFSLKGTVNGKGNKGTSIHHFTSNGVGNLHVIAYHSCTWRSSHKIKAVKKKLRLQNFYWV